MPTEADTCRTLVLPELYGAGWNDDQIREQVSFTHGRIVVVGGIAQRRRQKRADYILRYRRDFPIAVVEAKVEYREPGDGLQQAKQYAEILGLKFAYSTNGHAAVEHDYTTGVETRLQGFPGPEELWRRYRGWAELDDPAAERVLAPYYPSTDRPARYY